MAINIDKGANSDWIKMSWDIGGINSVEELKGLLDNLGISIAEFKKLPVYQFNKDRIPWLKEL